MAEKIKFKGGGEMFSPDEVARDLVVHFVKEESEKNIDPGNVGIWGADLESRIMTKLQSLEEESRRGDAELLARHVLFLLNSTTLRGEKGGNEKITKEESDAIKEAVIRSLEKYLSS